jgi:dihydroorotase
LKTFNVETGKLEHLKLSKINFDFPERGIADLDSLVLTPPFVDLHTHVRLNGGENYESLTSAAIAGGFLVLNIQPNTKPPIDSLEVLEKHIELSKNKLVAYNYTINLFSQIDNLEMVNKEYGEKISGYSTDGITYYSNDLVNGFRSKKPYLVFDHSQLHEIAGDFYLGSPLPNSARTYSNEAIAIFRTVMTGLEFGFKRFHIQHVSTLISIETISYLRKYALITCEVTPHHIFFTPDMVNHPNRKINPPISKYKDELIDAVRKGLIDTFATDHAPHPEKPENYEEAPYGSSHIEVAFSVYFTVFQDIELVLRNLTINPLKVLAKKYTDYGLRFPDDALLIDTMHSYNVDTSKFFSKGKNCAFDGCKLRGKILGVRRKGRWVYWNGEFISTL